MNTKLNRCAHCKKVLSPRNKSSLCLYHSQLEIKNEKNRHKCFICKKISKCQMGIIIHKTKRNFCTRHFNKLNQPGITQQEQKDLIRELKALPLCS